MTFDPDNDKYQMEWFIRFRDKPFDVVMGHMDSTRKKIFAELVMQAAHTHS
jgi:hypothetical protein